MPNGYRRCHVRTACTKNLGNTLTLPPCGHKGTSPRCKTVADERCQGVLFKAFDTVSAKLNWSRSPVAARTRLIIRE